MRRNLCGILRIPITNCNVFVLERIFIVLCRYLYWVLMNLQNYSRTIAMYSYTSIKRGIFSDYTIYQDSCNKIFKHFPNFHLHCLFYVEIATWSLASRKCKFQDDFQKITHNSIVDNEKKILIFFSQILVYSFVNFSFNPNNDWDSLFLTIWFLHYATFLVKMSFVA